MEIVNRTRKLIQPTISVIFPSRKRVEFLNEALYSLYSLADLQNANFEVIIKVDFDDHETLDYIKNWTNEYENLYFIVSSRKKGFLNLADFYEDSIDLAKGKYMFIFNDDLLMETQNWNSILASYLNDFKIYFPYVNGYREAFFVIPKELYTTLGHIAPHNQTDTYLNWLGQVLGINEYIDNVKLKHHFGYEDETLDDKMKVIDINYASRDYHRNSPEFKQDIKILAEKLGITQLNQITKL
jgi:hypothetical protein